MYKSFRVIDIHSHVFPEKMASKAVDATGEFYNLKMRYNGISKELIEEGTHAGVDNFLVFSTATTAQQVCKIDDFIVKTCAKYPQFMGFGTLHCDFEDFDAELERDIKIGLRGVKIHPDIQRFDLDDERMLPAYRKMARLGLPLLTHMGDDRYDFSHPARLSRIARENPDLICIGAHFGGYRVWNKVTQYVREDNVYFDTSSSLAFLSSDDAVALIRHYGADRFMFGTDYPMWDARDELERFFKLDLTDEERRLILSENFLRLFGEFK